jgi:hypothetical protein
VGQALSVHDPERMRGMPRGTENQNQHDAELALQNLPGGLLVGGASAFWYVGLQTHHSYQLMIVAQTQSWRKR